MVQCEKYAHLGNQGSPDFNWDLYENGYNGANLRVNKKVKTKNGDKVYCHEPYAQELYYKYKGINVMNAKDVHKGDLVPINDLHIVDDNTLIAVVGGGANNVIVDLNKETKLYQHFAIDTKVCDMQMFVDAIKHMPEVKEQFLSKGLYAKVTTDVEKGSIWDGYVDRLTAELKEQITLGNRAYFAKIVSTNNGGFVVDVADTIKAFMPGSMAAINKINDYESYVGKTIEVMVESWNPKNGFVVSRKKYLAHMRPTMLEPIANELKENPNHVYTGVITGATQYGIFVELDEFITGMLHKTYVSDELRNAMREGTVKPGTEIDVYVHRIDNIPDRESRVILSDVPVEERDAVIERRTAEDNVEKSEYLAQKAQNQTHKEKATVQNNA